MDTTYDTIKSKLSQNEIQVEATFQNLTTILEDTNQTNKQEVYTYISFAKWLHYDYNSMKQVITDNIDDINQLLQKYTDNMESDLQNFTQKHQISMQTLQDEKSKNLKELFTRLEEQTKLISKQKEEAKEKRDNDLEAKMQQAYKTYQIESSKIIGFHPIYNLFFLGSYKRNKEAQCNLDSTYKYFQIKTDTFNEFLQKIETLELTQKEEKATTKELKEKINKEYDKNSLAKNEKFEKEFLESKTLYDESLQKYQDTIQKTEKKLKIDNDSIIDFYKEHFHKDSKIKSDLFSLQSFENDIYKLFDGFEERVLQLQAEQKRGDKNKKLETKEIDKLRSNFHDTFINIGDFEYNIDNILSSTKAFIPLIHSNNVIFKYKTEAGKKKLSQLITSIVYRELLTLLDGKSKLTIIDPIGMGDSCSSLLGLDHKFYTAVYTDDRSIEEELVKLTKFISLVNTKYLKNNYKNIRQYNIGVGSVEEPYQILIAYDILDSFKNDSLKKLKAIMQNSTRTGIQTLLLQESDVEHENEYQAQEQTKLLNEISNMSIIIQETDNNFTITLPEHNQERDLNLYTSSILKLEEKNFLNDTLNKNIAHYLNYKIANIGDTKVSYIQKVQELLDNKEFWKKSASESIEANIGKAGREDQLFEINNKIEAHALLIGRSGSGKSNLLHMIITDLALNYSPEELRFYLIDMKGGIEFIRYVDHKLPHVDVTSITSDREMAHSVLQGLEIELQKREELFSANSVQNIAEYNKKKTQESVARLVLVLDEFQELFSKEDAIKRSAIEIFDRLAKKGRSFGINMILASQSLGGETLPSTTIAQLAVRIVLQCSEDDSMKVLSSNNLDAKLLSRPGEGIYNAKNGQTSGNQRFQTYFMEDNEDEKILAALSNYAAKAKLETTTRIFREDIRPSFEEFVPKTTLTQHNMILPIGQPYSLEDMISIDLKREMGANVLISGIQERLALNLFISLFSTLALQKDRAKKFYFFDTTAQNHPDYGLMQSYIEILEDNDFDVVIINKKSIEDDLQKIVQEIETAQEIQSNERDIYLFFFGLNKARNFKKADYSLSNEAALLSKILADGGEHGIHSFIYADNPKGLDNIFDNNTLKNDFESIIALQMSVDDSRRFIGTDNAGSLGKENAILFVENMNLIKKFRPLQLPNIKRLAKQLDTI